MPAECCAPPAPAEGGTGEVIRPPNRLKAKVGAAAGFDPHALARAEAGVASLASDFDADAPERVRRVRAALAAVPAEPAARAAAVARIHRAVFDFKSFGATFGFPLVTRIGESLCRFIEGRGAIGDDDLEIVKAHVDALATVICERIRDDGGELGRAVVAGLEAAVARFGTGADAPETAAPRD